MTFNYPGQFNIGFYNHHHVNTYLPQIWPCVCTGIEVNYTGSATWSQFRSGAPTDIELQLTFQEIVLPTKEVMQMEGKAFHRQGYTSSSRNNEQIQADLQNKYPKTAPHWVPEQWRKDTQNKDLSSKFHGEFRPL